MPDCRNSDCGEKVDANTHKAVPNKDFGRVGASPDTTWPKPILENKRLAKKQSPDKNIAEPTKNR